MLGPVVQVLVEWVQVQAVSVPFGWVQVVQVQGEEGDSPKKPVDHDRETYRVGLFVTQSRSHWAGRGSCIQIRLDRELDEHGPHAETWRMILEIVPVSSSSLSSHPPESDSG